MNINSAWLPAITSGLLAGLFTAVCAPALQHYIWRRQRLHEAKVALAERLAGLMPRMGRLFAYDTDRIERNLLMGELDTVLFSIQVLFAKKARTQCYELHLLLKRWNDGGYKAPPDVVVEGFAETYRSAADALATVYGEIFSKRLGDDWSIPYSKKKYDELRAKDESP